MYKMLTTISSERGSILWHYAVVDKVRYTPFQNFPRHSRVDSNKTLSLSNRAGLVIAELFMC